MSWPRAALQDVSNLVASEAIEAKADDSLQVNGNGNGNELGVQFLRLSSELEFWLQTPTQALPSAGAIVCGQRAPAAKLAAPARLARGWLHFQFTWHTDLSAADRVQWDCVGCARKVEFTALWPQLEGGH